jgi:hypothetical protein
MECSTAVTKFIQKSFKENKYSAQFMMVEMHFVFLQQVSHKKSDAGCNIPLEKLS